MTVTSTPRHDPSTWTSDWQGFLTHPDLLATFTPAYLRAARQLVAALALGGKIIHCPSPPNVLKDMYHHSCY